VRDAALDDDVRVTRTSCLGRCGEGPTVAVYPDGVWYRGVAAGDAQELVREHVVGDRLVARLIDQIVQ
jgi:(2Fe-2S) ferredoxin